MACPSSAFTAKRLAYFRAFYIQVSLFVRGDFQGAPGRRFLADAERRHLGTAGASLTFADAPPGGDRLMMQAPGMIQAPTVEDCKGQWLMRLITCSFSLRELMAPTFGRIKSENTEHLWSQRATL